MISEESIIHIHGMWNPALHMVARFAQKCRIAYVVSIRGMLADWALQQKATKKKLAWHFYQKNDLEGAAYILASSQSEKQDIAFHLPRSKVVVIPNGCERRPEASETYPLIKDAPGVRWAVALGRLHPVKGYADLIETWARLDRNDWKLAIAGPDENGYRKVLETLIIKHALNDRVFLLGEVSDSQKWSLLDRSELFVAPSKTENFGMAIAEALQSGTPVITTMGAPWRELQEYNCGWWVEPHSDALDLALRAATSSEAAVLKEMGSRGHNLISEKYSWNLVADSTIELYQSILAGKKRTSCH